MPHLTSDVLERPRALLSRLVSLKQEESSSSKKKHSCLFFESKFKKSISPLVMYAIRAGVTVETRERPLCSYNDVIYTCRPLFLISPACVESLLLHPPTKLSPKKRRIVEKGGCLSASNNFTKQLLLKFHLQLRMRMFTQVRYRCAAEEYRIGVERGF